MTLSGLALLAGYDIVSKLQGGPIKSVPLFYFCDNFRKCAPILTIFSLLEPEIYDA